MRLVRHERVKKRVRTFFREKHEDFDLILIDAALAAGRKQLPTCASGAPNTQPRNKNFDILEENGN